MGGVCHLSGLESKNLINSVVLMEGESEMKRLTKSATLLVLLAAFAVMTERSYGQQVNVVPFGSTWDYLFTAIDDGSGKLVATDPFANSSGVDFSQWAQPSFNTPSMTTEGRSLTWQTGPASFGFGDNGVTHGTPLSVPFSGQRDATHYFRHEFNVGSSLENLTLSAIVDDGMVVYLDGQRISSLESCCKNSANRNYDPVATPEVEVPYRERATVSNGPCRIEGVAFEQEIANITLSPGSHVLAASVHSISANSADMRFDLRLFQNVENQYQGDPSNNGGSYSGEWGDAGCGAESPSWAAGAAPDAPGAIARFLDIPTRSTTIYADDDKTLGTVIFDNRNTYALAGQGTLTFQSTDGNALVDVLRGDHEFQTAVSLSSNLDVNVASGTSVEFNNDLSLNGNNLTVGGGGGAVEINNNLFTDGGAVNAAAAAIVGSGPIHGDLLNTGGVVSPGNGVGVLSVIGDYRSTSSDSVIQLELAANENDLLQVSGELELSGELQVALADGFMPEAGASFQVFSADAVSGSLERISLPALNEGLNWDVSGISAGQLSVVPEPSGVLMLILGGLGLSVLRRRS